jgi:HD-GYP domain-containing protein (c-di-GMP phosphodiesterase class II)
MRRGLARPMKPALVPPEIPMPFAELSVVQQRIQVGTPLPFNVRDADRSLLLARGQVVASTDQMTALFARGALVDMDELIPGDVAVFDAPTARLPAMWRQCMDDVGQALHHGPHEGYAAALDAVATPVLALIERDPDLAIFQVLRQDTSDHIQYGVTHSVHAAITAHMVAQRLGWEASEIQTVFKAALTMNISMLELQGRLAVQRELVTADQHDAIHSHPRRSVEMLELAGVTDRDWLAAVAQHHEVAGGLGYPNALKEVFEPAALLRRADIYTAKLSGRAGRDAMTADQAGRQMFMQDPGHPMTVALAKEFGVYPPGCHVSLVNGELGVVLQRGPTVTTPVVAAITNERGATLAEPRRRDTSVREHAIVGVVADRRVSARVSPEKLMALVVERR